MDIYERYGRLMESYQQECENHRQTVDLLKRLKSGEVSLDSLHVTDTRWTILNVTVEEPAAEAPAS